MDMKRTMDYLQVRIYVFFLRSIAPLSILHGIVYLVRPQLPQLFSTFHLPTPIKYWLVAEAVAYIFLYLPYKYYFLQLPAIHPSTKSRQERQELFTRCWVTVADPEKYLKQWFLGARKNDIKRENVKEFVLWAFFNTDQVMEEDIEEVDFYVDEIERLLGRSLLPGRGDAKSMRVTLDNVSCSHRSIFWYFCIMVVDTINFCSMLYSGFDFYRTSGALFGTVFPFRPLTLLSTHKSPVKYLTYWYREHRSKERLPILFIHGIGVGLYPYSNFLRDINRTDILDRNDTTIGIVAIEIMAVSSRITYQAFDKDVLVNEIYQILKHHGWSKCVLVGHSYGTVICTHLLKSQQTASLIGPVLLVDPICFLLHLPDVAYNFTVRRPSHAKELILWYFGSKDIGIAHTLARRFFWSENILWKEDLRLDDGPVFGHRDTTVVLSGKDDIVDVRAVRLYLSPSKSAEFGTKDRVIGKVKENIEDSSMEFVGRESKEEDVTPWTGHGLESIWLGSLHHGQAFDFSSTRDCLIMMVRAYSSGGLAK